MPCPESEPDRPPGPRRAVGAWLPAFTAGLAAGLLYAATAARDVAWADSAEFLSVAQTWGVAHPPGYPLYSLLGGLLAHLLPGLAAWGLNLLSAVAGALACGLTAATLARAGGSTRPAAMAAVVAALGLAVGRTAWANSVVAEVYALHLLLVAALVGLVVAAPLPAPRRGVVAAWLFGLGLAHHPLILALLPVLVVLLAEAWRASESRGRLLASVLAGLVVPLGLYLYLPLAARRLPPFDWGHPVTLSRLLYHVTCRQYAHLTAVHPPRYLLAVLVAAWRDAPRELPLPWLLLAPVGWLGLARGRRAVAVALLLSLLLSLVLATSAAAYNPPYFIMVAWLLGLLGALGAARWLSDSRPARRAFGGVVLAAAAANTLALVMVNLPVCDQHANDLPRRYAARILAELPADAVVMPYSDSLSTLLQRARLIEGLRPDIDVLGLSDTAAVGSDEVLRHNFPRLVLPPHGYRLPTWPAGASTAWRAADEAELLRGLVVNNVRRRPAYVEYAPGLTWLNSNAVPAGHLLRLAPTPVKQLTPANLARHERLLAELLTEGEVRGILKRDPASQRVYSLAYNALGWYWLDREELEPAGRAFFAAAAIDPSDPATEGNLAALAARQGRTAEAEQRFTRAIRLAPWDAQLATNHARLLRGLGRAAAAEGEERRARSLGGGA